MPRRVGHVDAAGEHRDGQPVAGKRGPVRRPVDAVGTAGHDGDVAPRKTRGEIGGHMLAVGGAGPGSDDRRRPIGHLI
jgi:hypothetical protein